jgi:peptide-methionine (R)-S-oxide reductase
MKNLALILLAALVMVGCEERPAASITPSTAANTTAQDHAPETGPMTFPIQKTDAEWRAILTDEQYRVLRQKGTERPGTGEYCGVAKPGKYVCAGCGQPLFASGTKYESGTGWPSYFGPITPQAVVTEADHSLGRTRTEVLCSQCGGHLGHVFEDGPPPTGLRYCINSAALKHVPEGEEPASDR